MKTLLLSMLLLCCCAVVAAAQSRVSGAGASTAAILSVQVIVAGGAAFGWEREAGAARAQGTGRIALEGGRAPALSIQVWRSPGAPAPAGKSRELVAEGRVMSQRGAGGPRKLRLDAALEAAAREPGRYTVAVIY